MADLSQYVTAPPHLLNLNRTLEVNLFLYSADVGTLLNFKKKGEKISAEDLETIKKSSRLSVLILRSDQLTVSAAAIREALGQGPPQSTEVQKAATQMIGQISSEAKISPKEMLAQVPNLVVEIVQSFKKTTSAAAYQTILQKAKASENPITTHNQQVSALGVLILLTLGNATLEELSDLATAGLVHDLGLTRLPQPMVDLYFQDQILRSSERDNFLKHIDLTLEILKAEKVQVTPGVIRMIELHHEHWDGSGPKKVAGGAIYRPARVLRIADEIAIMIQAGNNKIGMHEALATMASRRGIQSQPIYDPDMIKSLLRSVVPQS